MVRVFELPLVLSVVLVVFIVNVSEAQDLRGTVNADVEVSPREVSVVDAALNHTVAHSKRRWPWNDLVIYVRDQGKCEEVTERPLRDCRWVAGLYPFVDQLVKHGRIIAYKIGIGFGIWWTNWYVPGINDIDLRFNVFSRKCPLPYKKNSLRRMWSYFYDHTHKYIICKQ